MNIGSLGMLSVNNFGQTDSKNTNYTDSVGNSWADYFSKNTHNQTQQGIQSNNTQAKSSNQDYAKKDYSKEDYAQHENEVEHEATDKEYTQKTDKDTTKDIKRKDSEINRKYKTKTSHQNQGQDVNEVLKQVQEQVVQMLMKHFNLSEKEVNQLLAEFNQEPLMLLEQEGFMDFMMEAMNISQEELLNGEVDIKAITKLFSELEEVKNQLQQSDFNLGEQEIVAVSEEFLQQGNSDSNTDNQKQDNSHNVQSLFLNAEDKGLNTFKLDMGTSELFLQAAQPTSKNFVHLNGNASVTNSYMQKHQILVDQIIEQIDLSTLQKNNEITMQLQPQNLGKLSIKIAEEQGIVVAQIKVEDEKVKEALLQDLSILESKLEMQGLKIGSFQVDVQEQSQKFTMQQQKQKSSRRIEEIMNKQLEDLSMELDDSTSTDTTDDHDDSTINLMA